MTSAFVDLATAWSHYPIIWSPHVSQDGAWLAWSWTGHSDTANVWIVPTDGSAPPLQLTQGSDHFHVNGIDADGCRLIVSLSRCTICRLIWRARLPPVPGLPRPSGTWASRRVSASRPERCITASRLSRN